MKSGYRLGGALFALLGLAAPARAQESAHLPNYALLQPIAEARNVVPIGHTRQSWLLRCADEPDAPPGLAVSAREREAGVVRCWPMLAGPEGEIRTAHPLRKAISATQEIEFLRGRIVRIRIHREFAVPANGQLSDITLSDPQAVLIDRLGD